MKIGIDGHTLSEKERFGVATYAFRLIEQIAQIKGEDDLLIYTKQKLEENFANNSGVNVKILKAKFGWTQWRLSLEFLLNTKPDVMLFLAHSISRYAPMPSIVTIHDLAFLMFDQYFTKKDLNRLKKLTKDAAKRAQHIIAPSESTKKDIVKFYSDVPNINKKITVIPMGIETETFYPKPMQEIAKTKLKYKIKRDYFLYVGSFQPRKNLPLLIKAYEKYREIVDEPIDLTMVGGKGWLTDEAFDSIKNSPAKEHIIVTGYVKREELANLYSGAMAFVLPSLYEGFGMPILEAMASGTPTIFANNSSMPEIADNAGIPFETNDFNDLSLKLKLISTDLKYRKEICEKGLKRAKEFSWKKTAEKTLTLLRKVSNEKK